MVFCGVSTHMSLPSCLTFGSPICERTGSGGLCLNDRIQDIHAQDFKFQDLGLPSHACLQHQRLEHKTYPNGWLKTQRASCSLRELNFCGRASLAYSFESL